ncbi:MULTISPECIES: hypothetical protein [Thalassolituus]|jgi:Spy/CpxP family protein refolding chaperone|uniref:hypothetical protein n=1 Tax=Thalassolituus TaxID=187492 RepID=UPI000C67CA6B|nr:MULTISPECIES: hypothetical protein [Thalassolituus]MAG43926.1 hypothetical protein [Oceanospirillaceae bacterium]MEC8907253.1 hypothetical protein [Pseudomonadota bacterium]HCG80428.1 hypothetical protein [Oceanospirillales bacterium]|tara:strand:- start:417 stop:1055 length:639 start_codon:yes stop_codon:yes gene_type:complete
MKMPTPIARFQRSLSLVACGVLMTTAQAWGFDDRQKKVDWESSLNLSDEQQEQIDAIEDKYRDRFREMKPSEAAGKERREQRQDLYVQMREEIRSVLTDEQQAIAEEQVRKREKEGREEHLERLSRKLDLTSEQKSELEEKLSSCSEEEWPVSMKMREKDRRDFEKAVKSVLTDEQKKKWRKMQREERDKWRHHDMDRLKDKRGEKDQEEGE